MAIEFIENELIIHVPNSEASIDAQHNGIKDSTVGGYYMSEMQPMVLDFLNNFVGDFYIDIPASLCNFKYIYKKLLEQKLESCFKYKLMPQKSAMEAMEWFVLNGECLYNIPAPVVNEKNKYLKFDNLNSIVANFRTLCLGELCDIHIKKIGDNGFIIYMKKNKNFDYIVEHDSRKWAR